jgi:isoleucyl-tRNA synthetase
VDFTINFIFRDPSRIYVYKDFNTKHNIKCILIKDQFPKIFNLSDKNFFEIFWRIYRKSIYWSRIWTFISIFPLNWKKKEFLKFLMINYIINNSGRGFVHNALSFDKEDYNLYIQKGIFSHDGWIVCHLMIKNILLLMFFNINIFVLQMQMKKLSKM